MKNITLMTVGAAVAITISLLAQALAFPTKAHAQTVTPAPISITVTAAPVAGTGNYVPSTSGIIAINDPSGRRVTLVSYNFTSAVYTPATGPPTPAFPLTPPHSS